jgi:hypothetical protein
MKAVKAHKRNAATNGQSVGPRFYFRHHKYLCARGRTEPVQAGNRMDTQVCRVIRARPYGRRSGSKKEKPRQAGLFGIIGSRDRPILTS